MVIIVTGKTGSGKTSFLQELVKCLEANNLRPAGVLAPSQTTSHAITYDVVDIEHKERICLIKDVPEVHWHQYKRFWFNPKGFELGNEIIDRSIANGRSCIIIDEIGPLELEGKGWAEAFTKALSAEVNILMVTVRYSLIASVVNHFGIEYPTIWYAGAADPNVCCNYLKEHL